MNIEKKGILNKREYHWLARHLSAKLAQNIPFCSIFPFFQYSLIHDLALSAHYCSLPLIYQIDPTELTLIIVLLEAAIFVMFCFYISDPADQQVFQNKVHLKN